MSTDVFAMPALGRLVSAAAGLESSRVPERITAHAALDRLREKFREIVSLPWKDALYDRLLAIEDSADVSTLFARG